MEGEKLTDKLDRLVSVLEQDKKVDDFKLPLGIRFFSKSKIKKKNYCVVMVIKTNSRMDIKLLPIEDDTISYNEQIYSATANFIMHYKKFPVIILPEWNSLPFSPADNYDEAKKAKTLTAGQKLIMTKMKLEAIKPKMNMNLKTIVMILGVLGIGYWILSSMGVF